MIGLTGRHEPEAMKDATTRSRRDPQASTVALVNIDACARQARRQVQSQLRIIERSQPLGPDRVSASRHIAAPAHAIFLIVTHPARHVDIDGSGMLEAPTDARPLTAVGQTFDMDMNRRPLGDIPNMAKYKVRCTVTQLIPDQLIEWTIRAMGKPPAGHVYGWQIEPLTDRECLVTNYCDWTNISDDLRARFRWPVVPVDSLQRSIENLDRLATRPKQS
jgi:hypothetical protein